MNNLYIGCKIKIIDCYDKSSWYWNKIGCEYTVIEIRPQYSDVVVENGNLVEDCDFIVLE